MDLGPLPLWFIPSQYNIFQKLESLISDSECVLVDAVYRGLKFIGKNDIIANIDGRTEHKISRACHETAIERLKNFHLLRHVWQHHVSTHKTFSLLF